MDDKHRRSSPVDDLHDARAEPMWSSPEPPRAVGRAPWQRVNGVAGYLGLHELADPGDGVAGTACGADPVSGEASAPGPGPVLVLAGQVTREVLDWYGFPGTGVLARVAVVEASGVEFLDEVGRALLLRVHLAARDRGRPVRLLAPSTAAVAGLVRHGALGLIQVHPPVEAPDSTG